MEAKTWTLGPDYPIVRCHRCGSHLELKDIKSGWCWVCGDMGAVEFKREGGTWAK
jgi:rRNA maturation endonuclease Nob1